MKTFSRSYREQIILCSRASRSCVQISVLSLFLLREMASRDSVLMKVLTKRVFACDCMIKIYDYFRHIHTSFSLRLDKTPATYGTTSTQHKQHRNTSGKYVCLYAYTVILKYSLYEYRSNIANDLVTYGTIDN